jgi:hypothetical protein
MYINIILFTQALTNLPVFIRMIYRSIFYAAAIYSSSLCIYKVNYSVLVCGPPWYLIESYFYSFGTFVQHIFPVFITAIANMMLLIATLNQKAKMKQN